MGRNKTKDKQKGTGKKNKDAAVFKVAGVRKPKTKSVSTNLKKVSLPVSQHSHVVIVLLSFCNAVICRVSQHSHIATVLLYIVNVVVCRVYEHNLVIVLLSYCKCCMYTHPVNQNWHQSEKSKSAESTKTVLLLLDCCHIVNVVFTPTQWVFIFLFI